MRAASAASRFRLGGARRAGKPGLGLVAGGAHEAFPLGTVGADARAVELAGGEVGELVAEDFVEEAVLGLGDDRARCG